MEYIVKKPFVLGLTMMMAISFTACAGGNSAASEPSSTNTAVSTSSVAENSEQQTETIESKDLSMEENGSMNNQTQETPTQTNENNTAITLTIGDIVIPATLNNTTTAQDLMTKLPYTISLNRYATDYCAVMSERLAYDEKDVQNGWLNGDISYEKETPYFVLFFGGEENSQQSGNQVIIGKVNDLSLLTGLDRNIDVVINFAE